MIVPKFHKVTGLEHHSCRYTNTLYWNSIQFICCRLRTDHCSQDYLKHCGHWPQLLLPSFPNMPQICTYTLSGSSWSCRSLDVTLALIPVPSHMTPISFATILMIPTGFPDGKRKINVISTIQMEKACFFSIDSLYFDADTQKLLVHLFVSE